MHTHMHVNTFIHIQTHIHAGIQIYIHLHTHVLNNFTSIIAHINTHDFGNH